MFLSTRGYLTQLSKLHIRESGHHKHQLVQKARKHFYSHNHTN